MSRTEAQRIIQFAGHLLLNDLEEQGPWIFSSDGDGNVTEEQVREAFASVGVTLDK